MEPPLPGWPTPRKHSPISLNCPGKVEPVPHTDNALHMPEHVDQADCDSVARDLPSDRDDAGPDCHIKGARVKGEAPGGDFLGHRIADLGIRPVEDAQYIHPAHDADQLTRIVNHRQPLYPAVMHEPGRMGQAVVWADSQRGLRHQLARRHPGSFGALPLAGTYQVPGQHIRPYLLKQQIRFGNHSHQVIRRVLCVPGISSTALTSRVALPAVRP